mmetsp:Transcript_47507/g.102372  ORF Transcript_47507/g.102372 Transcript_47507/m.102372 type:complete len:261 (+) Transcript_47507:898-1680(+)
MESSLRCLRPACPSDEWLAMLFALPGLHRWSDCLRHRLRGALRLRHAHPGLNHRHHSRGSRHIDARSLRLSYRSRSGRQCRCFHCECDRKQLGECLPRHWAPLVDVGHLLERCWCYARMVGQAWRICYFLPEWSLHRQERGSCIWCCGLHCGSHRGSRHHSRSAREVRGRAGRCLHASGDVCLCSCHVVVPLLWTLHLENHRWRCRHRRASFRCFHRLLQRRKSLAAVGSHSFLLLPRQVGGPQGGHARLGARRGGTSKF